MPVEDKALVPGKSARDDPNAAREAASRAAAVLKSLPSDYLPTAKAAAAIFIRQRESMRLQMASISKAATLLDADRRAAIGSIMRSALIPPAYLSSIAEVARTTKMAVDGLAAAQATLSRSADAVLKPLREVFARIAAEEGKARLVSGCGWLPHETMPFNRLTAEDSSPDAIDALIEAYYRDNWPAIEEALSASVNGYDVDDEAKATFQEALAAHRHDLHRVAPRLLFPEIERVVSVEFYGGEHQAVPATGGKKRPITSLKEVREAVQRMPAGDVLSYAFSTGLLDRLDTHLYATVGDDPGNLARFSADPVPNRHAALHGLVTYRSRKTSLNALIMTDFIFHIVSRLKRQVVQNGEHGVQQYPFDDDHRA